MDAIYPENLTQKYGDNEVLQGVNLGIKEGEFYVLMEPNGSGKTTLASIMTSVRSPSSTRDFCCRFGRLFNMLEKKMKYSEGKK